MTARFPFRLTRSRIWLIGLTTAALICVGLALVMSLMQTRNSLQAFKSLQFETAANQAQSIQPVAALLSALTLRQIESIEAWNQALALTTKLPAALESWSPFATESTTPLTTWSDQALATAQTATKSRLLTFLLPSQSKQLRQLAQTLGVFNQRLLSGHHTFIVVFQNSEELRATGGFMGSYATVKLNQGQIEEIAIQDIYEPDGQFKGFLEPPTGVKQYLSSGNGLRLPDANWWPDFPSSAQKMLPFFAFGQEQAAEGIIVVNLDVAEHILQVTGPVFLPDYQTTVTAENLADVARADREEFFPGSKGKPHFLSSLFNQLKFKLADLNQDQKKALFQYLATDLRHKQIQLYSNHEDLQQVWENWQVAGATSAQTTTISPDLYFFLVESNVGINKANQAVTREVKLDLSDYRTQVSLVFHNQNPHQLATPPKKNRAEATHLHYINYQRLLVLPQTQLKSLTFQGQPITTWDENLITDANGEQFKQIGFLVEVPEASDATVTIELTHQALGEKPLIVIQKQSGLSAVPYEITLNNQTRSWLLETDEVISW